MLSHEILPKLFPQYPAVMLPLMQSSEYVCVCVCGGGVTCTVRSLYFRTLHTASSLGQSELGNSSKKKLLDLDGEKEKVHWGQSYQTARGTLISWKNCNHANQPTKCSSNT